MESVAGKLKKFEKPVRVTVEYIDGFVSTVYECVGIYINDGVLKFEILANGKSRFRCYLLDMVHKFVIFEDELEGREGQFCNKKLRNLA